MQRGGREVAPRALECDRDNVALSEENCSDLSELSLSKTSGSQHNQLLNEKQRSSDQIPVEKPDGSIRWNRAVHRQHLGDFEGVGVSDKHVSVLIGGDTRGLIESRRRASTNLRTESSAPPPSPRPTILPGHYGERRRLQVNERAVFKKTEGVPGVYASLSLCRVQGILRCVLAKPVFKVLLRKPKDCLCRVDH